MKICDCCLKQDICKFKSEVEKYEVKTELPEPLESAVTCKHKEVAGWNFRVYYL